MGKGFSPYPESSLPPFKDGMNPAQFASATITRGSMDRPWTTKTNALSKAGIKR